MGIDFFLNDSSNSCEIPFPKERPCIPPLVMPCYHPPPERPSVECPQRGQEIYLWEKYFL